MKVTALAPWYGSKRSMAAEIVAALGPHRVYWEPFCGSMAVLLSKPRVTMETVNDLHGDLINLARVLQDESLALKLYKRLRRTLFCQDLWREAAAEFRSEGFRAAVPELDFERAARWAIFAWFGRNGVIGSNGGVNFCARYTANGGQPALRWQNWVASIPSFHSRLRGVTILRVDAFSMIERIEDETRSAIYVDPPYLAKGALYEYDFAADDHRRLAGLLDRFKRTRVVVSYYDHPLLDDLYPGWAKINCARSKALVAQGRRDRDNKATAPEVLLVNDRSGGLFE